MDLDLFLIVFRFVLIICAGVFLIMHFKNKPGTKAEKIGTYGLIICGGILVISIIYLILSEIFLKHYI